MNSKQDNLRAFRGHLKREIRKTKDAARDERERQQLLKEHENIRIDTWNKRDEKNNWMFIRLYFKNPLIPNKFIPELKMSLGEIFSEHL